ncbi:M20/M25/M40 family metallo-hydrolase [Dokdonia sinensis]|uniref:M20/M25/M40 family metallo-hydrolase n=1 Tax=Dokdonia sinensis TaxID=2479847 RepID=A0A3M0GIR9_9FLAO|nr:M20/M25/M40 family metallo-hydrolase [Dokdonia sinensis]RMB57176.1 M20/M25/M40 family metallo-hydrolase [Dokdonia sinensis]
MKKIIAILGISTLVSCGSGQLISVNEDNAGQPITTQSTTATESSGITKTEQKELTPAPGILGSSKTTSVRKTMEFLASDDLGGRDTGSPGIQKAAKYIEGRFTRSNIKPYFKDNYRSIFEVNEQEAFNIVGMIEGTDPRLKNELVIIGAHYDHIGNNAKAVNGDNIANGANDNAAGTTAVLAIADHFAKAKNNKRTLVFALFSAEEKGLKGSADLARKMKAQGAKPYVMFNIEMIGVPMIGKDHLVYCSGYDLSNLAEKFNEYADEKVIGFLPKAKEFNLFKRSDNYPFYTQFKIPAQTISSFDFTNYDYYHHVDDEASEMDYVFMQTVINKVVPGIAKMANTPKKEIKMNE